LTPGSVLLVIVTYNSARVIEPLLDSVPAALGNVPGRIVVVDNDSTDGTRDLLRARPDCQVVESPNVGYAAGVNLGVRNSPPTDAILVLNPDCVLSPGSIAAMMPALTLPDTGLVAPRITAPDGRLQLSMRREPSILRALGLSRTGWPVFSEYVSDPAAYTRANVANWVLGAVMLVSRRCFDALGGLDESYFLYSEETDFCLRATDQGFVVRYVPDVTVVHIGGASGQSERTQAMQIVNRVRLYRRRHSVPAAYVYFGLTVLSEISRVLRGRPESRFVTRALLRPAARPVEIGCSDRLLPT
jgi:N-acetylglucosaminyl-diphospho-decaprenol L-rhamnosyltransferase